MAVQIDKSRYVGEFHNNLGHFYKEQMVKWLNLPPVPQKGLFTSSESERESEKDQRTSCQPIKTKEQLTNIKKSLSLRMSLVVNGPLKEPSSGYILPRFTVYHEVAATHLNAIQQEGKGVQVEAQNYNSP